MTHTLLLLILSLFLTGVSSEATTLRTYPEGRTLSYTDDGALLRAETWTGHLTHQWLYHGPLTPIAQLDNQGQVVARYVYGSQDHVPDYLLMGEAIYRLVTDHLGSVRLVVNVMTGEVVQRLDYEVWGNVLQDTNPGFQPFGFAGGLYDSDTQWVRFGARDYDAESGRWTSKEPLKFDGNSYNFYSYVDNDPINLRDPRGENAVAVGIRIGAGIGSLAGPEGTIAGAVVGATIGVVIGIYLNEEETETKVDDISDEGGKSVNDIIGDLVKGSTITGKTGKVTNGVREGGEEQRDKDFDALPGEVDPNKPHIKILPDGRTVNKHVSTSEGSRGAPTLDLPSRNATNPKTRIKIRYPSCP